MAKSSYAKFANRIGTVGGLYFGPVTDKSVWARIIEKLISAEECELGMKLTKEPISAEDYAKKVNKPVEEVSKMLWNMADHGTIFAHFIDGKPYYRMAPYIPGVYEYLMDHRTMDKDMAALFVEASEETAGTTKLMSPIDGGLMKVAPVMKEIKAQQKILSHEDVLYFINKADKFSVCDCACRTALKLLDKGCEHPIHDICLQLGPHAEYYVRTGRGRYITKEEAIEVLDRAEEAGLVHTIFATEGLNNTSYICNCCSCSCSGFRTMLQYGGGAFSASNFRAKIESEKCVACGACVDICPVNAIKLGNNLCSKDINQIEPYKRSFDSPWGKKDWNPNFRARKQVSPLGTAPCKTICPAHISVQGYIEKASEGKYLEALELIKKDNPFPAVCGRICPHPCESECTRGSVDEPLAIDAIKMFIADKELELGNRFVPQIKDNYVQKVAIIGSGPAGLSCAYYLAVDGYKVTVFEKQEKLGGMLTLGIPSFRLDKNVVKTEIDILKELGVEFRTGIDVGKDVTIPSLREDGFKAFYMAIGAQKGAKLGLDGEELPQVKNGVDFLRDINLGIGEKLSGSVVVVGGGNVAIDVARAALREGASKVDMYCLESSEEMPAARDEQDEARDEGIVIHNSWGPMSIEQQDGKVSGVLFKKCVSVFDAGHRFAPKFDENISTFAEATTVLLSIGQTIDWGGITESAKIELDSRKRIIVKDVSYQSSESDVFAGGDVVTGPKFAIDAIATGKQGAQSIHRFLQGRDLTMSREIEFKALDKRNLDTDGYDRIPRQKTGAVDPAQAKSTYADLRMGLTEDQIKAETQRCLHCGRSIVDTDKCVGCGVCTRQCKFDAIHLERVGETAPAETFAEFYKRIAKYSAARAGRIAVKGVKNVFTSGK